MIVQIGSKTFFWQGSGILCMKVNIQSRMRKNG